MNKIIVLCLAFSMVTPAAWAKVYRCNNNGKVSYTATYHQGCTSDTLPELGSYSVKSKPKRVNSAVNSTKATRAKAAPEEITARVLQSKDEARISILKQELSNEQESLAQAKSRLNDVESREKTPSSEAEAQLLREEISDRTNNIEALNRELSRM